MDFTKKNLAASVVFAHRLNIYSKLSRKLCLKKSRYLKLSTRMSEGAAGAELASSLQVVPGVTTEPGFKPVSTVREKPINFRGNDGEAADTNKRREYRQNFVLWSCEWRHV